MSDDIVDRLRSGAGFLRDRSIVTHGQRIVTAMDMTEAADALEAAEATIAQLEHHHHQAEVAASLAYRDAEAAEAKLAAIDAILTEPFPDTAASALYDIHRILHPEETP